MDDQTKQCPQCKGTVSQNAQECPLCGVIFKRYEETRDRLKKTAISAYENGDLPNSRKLFKTLIEHFPDLTDLLKPSKVKPIMVYCFHEMQKKI